MNNPYNISAGRNLDDFPIIQSALHAIAGKWEFLLQSPFIATCDEDIEVGAILDKIRREKNIIRPTLTSLLPIITKTTNNIS